MVRSILFSAISSLKGLVQTPRFWLVLLIEILLLWSAVVPLYAFVETIGYRINPCVIPFIATHPISQLFFLLGLALIFADAPFLSANQLFILVRSGRVAWTLGKVLYIGLVSVLYWAVLIVASLALLLPCESVCVQGWGTALSTLAETDAASSIGLSFGVSARMLSDYQPLQALLLMFGVETLVGVVLGLIVMAGNLATKNKAGMGLAVLVILLDLLVVNVLPTTFYSWSVASHGRLDVFSEVDPSCPTLGYAVGFDLTCAVALSVLAVLLVWKTDLVARPTM